MTGSLVGPSKRLVVDIAQLLGVLMRDADCVGQLVVALLRQFVLIDDDGVVEVASLDKSQVEQRLNLPDEYKRPCRGDFLRELTETVECGELAGQYLGVELNHDVDVEIVVRHDDDMFSVVTLDFNLFLHDVELSVGFLLLQSRFLYFLYEHGCRSVENRHLWAVELYKAVVDAHGIESRHGMLDGADLHVVLDKDRSALCVAYKISRTFNDRLSFDIYPLNLISIVLLSRQKDGIDKLSGV